MELVINEKYTVFFKSIEEAEKFVKEKNIKAYKFYTPLYTEYGVILAWD